MNQLSGTLSGLEIHGSIALVEVAVGPHRLTATLLGASAAMAAWSVGRPLTLLFKDTEVSLAKNLSGLISLRNRMPSQVVAVETGTLLTRVVLDFDGHSIASVITTRSARLLDIAVGDRVEALVKANEMSVLDAPPSPDP